MRPRQDCHSGRCKASNALGVGHWHVTGISNHHEHSEDRFGRQRRPVHLRPRAQRRGIQPCAPHARSDVAELDTRCELGSSGRTRRIEDETRTSNANERFTPCPLSSRSSPSCLPLRSRRLSSSCTPPSGRARSVACPRLTQCECASRLARAKCRSEPRAGNVPRLLGRNRLAHPARAHGIVMNRTITSRQATRFTSDGAKLVTAVVVRIRPATLPELVESGLYALAVRMVATGAR